MQLKFINWHEQLNSQFSIMVMHIGRILCIPIDTINHISRQGNYSVIYTEQEKFRTPHSLQDLLHELPHTEFYRVHRSHIICLKKITSKYKRKIWVGEYQLYISKYYEQIILKELAKKIDAAIQFYQR